jgi:Mn-dependent DtxR family transcriptional regulator
MEELTSTHLRYLLAIYQIAKLERDVCSTSISQFLSVSGPSVSRMLGILMQKKLIVKKRYSKIYLTDTGFLLARNLDKNITLLKERIPRMGIPLTEEEIEQAAFSLAALLPGKH